MRFIRSLCIVPAALFAVSIAHAQSTPWYGGISAGQSKIKIDDSSAAVTGATASTLSKDENDTGLKLFGGYRFNRNFALEGGYVDFGKFSATRNVTAPVVGSAKADIKSSGLYIDAVGILPLANDKLDLFGKVGAIYTTTKSSFSATGPITAAGNEKKNEGDWKYGLGAEWHFTPALGLRGEWERALKVGDPNKTGEGDIDLVSVGLTWRF